jgi:hypothetical protein
LIINPWAIKERRRQWREAKSAADWNIFGTMAINYESDIFFNPLICQQIGFLARKLSLTKVRNG